MTINEGKELAQARKPILLGTFTFSDGTVLRVATLGCVFEGETYEARVDEQDIDRLASLSEQGVSLVPSVKIRLADPDAYLWTNYERAAGKGFRGATLQLRFALLEPNTGEFSTDSLIPFLGLCDQPSLDEKYLTVSAVSRLNLSRYSLPVMPMQLRCPAINPATAAQRIEAADPTSKFYFCGETRDLVAAPPCEYNKQTCTQLARYAGSTWQVSKEGSGREYVSGNRISWQNPDTSGKYREAWPLWLGGKAWVMGIPLAPWADGNYSRTEVAVGFGNIAIEKVVVNGVELTQGMEGDYRWHYVNQGNRDGFHNSDTGYENGDVYGNCTVIQVLAPHAVFAPGSTPEVKILGTPQDLMCFNGAAWVAGDGLAAGSLGGASTPWVLMRALWWSRVDYAEVDPQSFVAASMICDPLIQFTDKDGVIDQQPRFTSAVALRERRSASEIVRGLLQSISGILRPDATGKIKLKIEGPLAEQQPAPVDGSNYDTPVASTLRDGTPANGYFAYHFDESNSWNFRRIARPLSETPNRVRFPFSDPACDFAVSDFSVADSDDVSRTGQESPGGLQVEPVGIASQNHAWRAAKLGLAKIHRGNPAGDTRGTDWFQWEASFRGVRLELGDLVAITRTREGLTLQAVRITEIKPSRNYETVTLTGHWHSDNWYLDAAGTTADAGVEPYSYDPSVGANTIAPNVTTATCVPYYCNDDGGAEVATGTLYGFQGVITLPTADAAYSHLRYIQVYGTPPDGIERMLSEVTAPFAGATVDWKSPAWDRPGANATFTGIRFVCFNEDSTATADPFTVASVNVVGQPNPPLLPLTVTGEELPAERYLETPSNLTYTKVQVTVTLPANHRALWFTAWLSEDDGATWLPYDMGKWWLTETAVFVRVAPVAAANWKVKVITGNHQGENDPADAVVSASFAVGGLAAPIAGGVTNASVTLPVLREVTPEGVQYWGLEAITWTNPTAAEDPNFFHSQLRVRMVDVDGNLAPIEQGGYVQIVDEDAVTGGTHVSTMVHWWEYNPAGSAFTYARFDIITKNRALDETVQNCWPGGAAYFDVNFGASPGAGDITEGTPDYRHLSDGTTEIRWPFTAPADDQFAGVMLEVEAPDQSAAPQAKADGTTPWDGTYALVGDKKPLAFRRPYDSANPQPLVAVIPTPTYSMSVRLRAKSYSAIGINATGLEVTLTVDPPTVAKPNAATAHTQNPTGISIVTQADEDVGGKLHTFITFAVTGIPTSDPTFAGYEIVSVWPDGYVSDPHTGILTDATTPVETDTPSAVTAVKFYVRGCSIDALGNVQRNPIVPGVTPYCDVTLGTTAGTVDLGAAVTTSIGAALSVVNGVLGVPAGSITESLIDTFAVSAQKIAAGAVETAKIADLSVITSKLAAAAVDTTKLADLAVTAAKLANGEIDDTKLKDAAVTTAKLAGGAVDTTKLAALAVEAANLANSSVTATKIANLAVGSAAIQALAVGTAHIADGAILSAKIGDAQITTAKIANAAVGTAAIANLAVGTAHLQNAAVTNAKIGNLAVSTAQIQDAAITTAKIQNLAVTTALINDLAVTQAKIGLLAVGSAQIADLAVTDAKIANATITSAKIISLAADKIDAGTINAALSITSPTITSTSGANMASLRDGYVEATSTAYRARLFSGVLSLTTIAVGQPFAQVTSDGLSCLNSSGFSVASVSNVNGIRVNNLTGTNRISLTDSAANFTSCPIQISGVTVIDSSRNGSLLSLAINGSSAIDSSRNFSGATLTCSGNIVSTAGNLGGVDLSISGWVYIDSVACLKGQGAHVADATGAGDIVAQFNTLLSRLEGMGLLAAA